MRKERRKESIIHPLKIKTIKFYPKHTKMSLEEKETYDNEMKIDKNSEDNIELVDNTITIDSTKEDVKDDKKEKKEGSNLKEASITMLWISEKALEVKKYLSKGLVFKEMQR